MRLSRRSFYKCYLVFLCIIMMLSGICYGAGPDDPVSTSEKNNVTSNRARQSASFSQAEQVSQPIQSDEHAYKLGEELDTTKIKVRLNREPCTWVSWCYAIINELKNDVDNENFKNFIYDIGLSDNIIAAEQDNERHGMKEKNFRFLLAACSSHSVQIDALRKTLEDKLEKHFPNKFEVTIIESGLEERFDPLYSKIDPLYYIDIQAGGGSISTSRVEMFEGEKVVVESRFSRRQKKVWIRAISDSIMDEEGGLADVLEMSRFILRSKQVDSILKNSAQNECCYQLISEIYRYLAYIINAGQNPAMQIIKRLFDHFYPGRLELKLPDSASYSRSSSVLRRGRVKLSR